MSSTQDYLKAGVPLFVGICLRYPKLCIGLVSCLALMCTVLSFEFLDLTDPLVGLRIREDIAAEKADAWIVARNDYLRPEEGL